MTKIDACFFCGSKCNHVNEDDSHWIECSSCQYASPSYKTPEEATKKHNAISDQEHENDLIWDLACKFLDALGIVPKSRGETTPEQFIRGEEVAKNLTARVQELEAEVSGMLGLLQQHQPAGSPPPGGPIMMTKWILDSMQDNLNWLSLERQVLQMKIQDQSEILKELTACPPDVPLMMHIKKTGQAWMKLAELEQTKPIDIVNRFSI